jgi:hypothetical protein
LICAPALFGTRIRRIRLITTDLKTETFSFFVLFFRVFRVFRGFCFEDANQGILSRTKKPNHETHETHETHEEEHEKEWHGQKISDPVLDPSDPPIRVQEITFHERTTFQWTSVLHWRLSILNDRR